MTQTTNLAGELDNILREDVASARQRERNAFDELVAPFGDSLVLFGAGNLGRQVLAQLRQDGIEPLTFSDNNHSIHGSVIDGLAVLSPREAATRFGQSASFVVTIWNTNHSFVETQKKLRGLGCIKVVSAATFRWKHPEGFLPFFWANLPSKTLEQAEQVRSAFTLWADDFSRQEYIAQLCWRISGDFDLLAPPVAQGPRFAVEFGPFLTGTEAERTERQLNQAGHQTVRFRQSNGCPHRGLPLDVLSSRGAAHGSRR